MGDLLACLLLVSLLYYLEVTIYRLSDWEGYVPKEASTFLRDEFMYQHKIPDFASANPEPLLIAVTDERSFKHKFMFLRKANTITLSLIYFTSSGQELLFPIPLMMHLQKTVFEWRDVVSHTFVFMLSQPPLEERNFVLSDLVMVQRNLLGNVSCSLPAL